MPEKLNIISVPINHLKFSECLDIVSGLAKKRKPSYVCFANVHMTIEAHRNKDFSHQISEADLVLADGKPISIACKLLYQRKQERIAGIDFVPCILKIADEKRLSVFLYGSTDTVLQAAKQKISSKFPGVKISGIISPPFSQLSKEETENHIQQINDSGAHIVLVSLGCPKQEKWMHENSAKINALLLGIGAALPVFGGMRKRAPMWMQNFALEWLFRSYQQPSLLFTRYLYTNSYFLWLFGKTWLKRLVNQEKIKRKIYDPNHAST